MNKQTKKAPSSTSIKIYLRLLEYVWPYWKPFSVSLLGFLIFALTQPALAALMEYLVDSLQAENRSEIYWVPLATICIVFFRGIGSFLGSYYIAKVANNVVHNLRCEIFNKYTALPNSYFDDQNSGHLLSRVTYNVSQVTSAATDAIKVVVREGLTIIGLLGYLLYMNWALSLIFLAIAPIIGLLVRYAGKRFKAISKRIQTSMGDITHVSSELINNYRVVRSFGGEDYEKKRFKEASFSNFKQAMKMVQTGAINTPVLQLIVASALALMIYLALLFMTNATPGEFIAYITAAGLMPKPIRQLSEVNANIQKGIAGAESIFEIFDTQPEQDDGEYSVNKVSGHIKIRNLDFSYPGTNKTVLKNINIDIKPGMMVALVGRSGSGKTTLANLIPRFYTHQQGDILLDDVDINQYTLKNLRHHISLVTQNITLFNDTIANNIAYGTLKNTPLDEIKQAARDANAAEFIEQLPNGWDTLVGENGLKLSGGQRQRIAIARALLKNAPILILDEATSALDTESEQLIQNAFEKAVKNRTTIVIAHRLSTIQNADEILIMDKGKIIESGTHSTLLANNGAYTKLLKNQVTTP
ncbi:MAG: lipid A export permease/ATP-binding protein MsbA [Cycloclasticus pugetii]|uniref:lipid A export permease/ATP-binding protein MsbA n=1 Tax=Cycloclasticus TaxID=34067 RepID=UPI000286A8F2|nr:MULTISPECIES: lipid A export permease/ATP-binding protein MsbA [Cycloclasticus]AFT67804.1 lipid A ABC transporter, ATP-binding/permease protein [Cycloclasticus sp. P1]SHI57525.1 ATP-binding cassette, subfamily B, MsbA [Cycloclasticus pugetii]